MSKQQRPITTLVFDVGNVLFGYNPDTIVQGLLPDTQHAQSYIDTVFLSDLWQQMDRGDVSEESAIDQLTTLFNQDTGHRQAVTTLIQGFHRFLTPITEVHHLFMSLQRTYPVYILSNFQSKPFQRLRKMYPFLDTAIGQVVSADVNLAKPEAEIYHHLLSTFSLTPENCLFIDDLEANIKAAKAVGIQGIVYTDPESLIAQLQDYGISGTALS